MRDLIECETPPGFHASLGRGNPCTLVIREEGCGTEFTLSEVVGSLLEGLKGKCFRSSTLSLSEERVRERCRAGRRGVFGIAAGRLERAGGRGKRGKASRNLDPHPPREDARRPLPDRERREGCAA
jgi:hypothetical protein